MFTCVCVANFSEKFGMQKLTAMKNANESQSKVRYEFEKKNPQIINGRRISSKRVEQHGTTILMSADLISLLTVLAPPAPRKQMTNFSCRHTHTSTDTHSAISTVYI